MAAATGAGEGAATAGAGVVARVVVAAKGAGEVVGWVPAALLAAWPVVLRPWLAACPQGAVRWCLCPWVGVLRWCLRT